MNASRVARLLRPMSFVTKARSTRMYSTLPLTEPLPTVPSQSDAPQAKPVLQTSVLPNGIRVATVASQVPVAAVGVFVEAGSRYENLHTAGSSFVLKNMAFSTTQNRTALRLVREFETAGATYTSAVGREYMLYSSEMQSDKVADVLPILADVLHPRLAEFEVRDQQHLIEEESHELQSDARSFLFEALHATAFRNKGLGQPLYVPESNVHHLDHNALKDFVNNLYTTDRIVVTATGGVEHEEFVQLVSKAFEKEKAGGARVARPASEYQGGEYRQADNFDTHLAVAFHGLSWADKDIYALKVLQALLGGSYQTLSSGGPGRGVTSRLGSKVQGPIYELAAFNLSYSDTGLFGVFARSEQGNAASVADLITSELNKTFTKASPAELQRAINQAKASVLFDNQSRSSVLEFVGVQAVAQRPPQSPEQFAKALESVTADDIVRVAKRVLSSRPTVAALGDVINLPSVEAIQKAIKV